MPKQSLQRRKHLLAELGHTSNASRSSWSHDLGDSIVFDAWDDQWERDENGDFKRYALRTSGSHYNPNSLLENPRRGHVRWQQHVDLVLAGKRSAKAIVPVAVSPTEHGKKGAKGWLPLLISGLIETDSGGDVWLVRTQTAPLSRSNPA